MIIIKMNVMSRCMDIEHDYTAKGGTSCGRRLNIFYIRLNNLSEEVNQILGYHCKSSIPLKTTNSKVYKQSSLPIGTPHHTPFIEPNLFKSVAQCLVSIINLKNSLVPDG